IADNIDRLDAELLASGRETTQEAHTSITTANGERSVTTKRHAVRDVDGTPLYLVSVVEDVGDRLRLEQELGRERTFLNQIVENIPTTVVVKDIRTRHYVLV